VADQYRLIERPPAMAEYCSLISAVGWAEWTNFDAADAALAHSLYHVVALREEAVIGMARVVGDGAMFFYIQDVVVVPAHQGRGVGTLLLERVIGLSQGCCAGEGVHRHLRCRGEAPVLRAFWLRRQAPPDGHVPPCARLRFLVTLRQPSARGIVRRPDYPTFILLQLQHDPLPLPGTASVRIYHYPAWGRDGAAWGAVAVAVRLASRGRRALSPSTADTANRITTTP